jgi:hypothetical protein
MALNETKKLAISISVKETTTAADLYEEVAGKSGYLSTETGWTSVTDVAPSMVRRNSGVSPLVTNDVKNRVDCDDNMPLHHKPVGFVFEIRQTY